MAHEKFYFNDPKSPVQKLSNTEIEYIIEAYKSGEYVMAIQKEFPRIKSNESFFNNIPYTLTDEKCECCSAPIYNKPKRKAYKSKMVKLCIACHHNYTDNCFCDACETERADKKKKEQELFDEAWKDPLDKEYRVKYELEGISIYDEISLAVIASKVKHGDMDYLRFAPMSMSNRFGHFKMLEEHEIPTELNDVANPLMKRDLIIPSIHCDKNIAEFPDDFLYVDYENKDKFYWDFNIYKYGDKLTPLSLLQNVKEREFSASEKSALWRDIYKSEVKQYGIHATQDIFRFDLDSHLYDYITDIVIEDYSLSQTYALIYFTASAALRYEAKYPVDSRKFNTFFRNKISANANKYKNDSTARNFNRISYFEISLSNQFAMRYILGDIESKFFYLKTEDIIPDFQSDVIDENYF